MSLQVKGALILGLAMLAFSASSALVKVACAHVPVMEVVFVRGISGAIILFALATYKRVPLGGKRKGLLLTRGVCGTVAIMLYYHALTRIPVADTMLLNQAAPVFVLPLAAIFLKERITWRHGLFVLMALFGVTVVIRPSTELVNVPGMVALSSAFFAACAYVLVRKLTATEHTLTIVFWFTTVTVIVATPFMLLDFVVPDARTLAVLAAVGLFGTAGQLLLTRAYSYGEAGRLAVVGSLGAVMGAGWDLVIWGHTPDIWTAAGGIVIITACAAIQMLRRSTGPGVRN